jgi:thiamine biosynthesis lipoprotein ApbE
VIAPDGLTADALATALSVLGKDGLKIIEKMKDVEALVITIEGGKPAEYKTGGFARFLKDQY